MSIETSLLTLTGFAMVYLAITGPLTEAMLVLEGAKREECAYKTLRAIDLAISAAVGGGSSSSIVNIPCEVKISGSGSSITVSSEDKVFTLNYPFKVQASGVLSGSATVEARFVNGTVYVEVHPNGG